MNPPPIPEERKEYNLASFSDTFSITNSNVILKMLVGYNKAPGMIKIGLPNGVYDPITWQNKQCVRITTVACEN